MADPVTDRAVGRLGLGENATVLAFAAAAFLWRRVGRGDDGLTVPDVQLAVARRNGVVRVGRAAGRTLAAAITVGGGGSAGSEGPVAVLGAAAGSVLARAFRFSPRRARVLVGAGAGAAIAAAFNAPLAGRSWPSRRSSARSR